MQDNVVRLSDYRRTHRGSRAAVMVQTQPMDFLYSPLLFAWAMLSAMAITWWMMVA
jgi:hypothetical protein